MVQILLGALKKAGCPIDLKRHIVCEECSPQVTGGYDFEFNQIVVCYNSFKARHNVQNVLTHELVHMYDYCTGELNLKNMDHLACSEIRAANIAHCSFLSSFFLGQSSFTNIKQTHQYCVMMKAAQSVALARNIDVKDALYYVDRVFDKCYKDLEPIGRRIRRNSGDAKLAHVEAQHFGIL